MQVIAWVLGEYGGGVGQDQAKVSKIMSLLAQFARGAYADDRTRAAILLALTKLHATLGFSENDQVESIMKDYSTSRMVEVQDRAFEYMTLRACSIDPAILFRVPLTES